MGKIVNRRDVITALVATLVTVVVNIGIEAFKYFVFSENSKLTIRYSGDEFKDNKCFHSFSVKNHSNDIIKDFSIGWQNIPSNTLVSIQGPYVNTQFISNKSDYLIEPITLLRTHKYVSSISYEGDCTLGATPVVYIRNYGIDIK